MTCIQSCRLAFAGHTDAAKRISDAMILAWEADGWDSVGKWMSFRLDDGSTDHVLYPSKYDAVRHVSNEMLYAFLKTHPAGMGVCEAEIMLAFIRGAVEKGFRLADPDRRDGGHDIIPRIGTAEALDQLFNLRRGR